MIVTTLSGSQRNAKFEGLIPAIPKLEALIERKKAEELIGKPSATYVVLYC